MNKHIAGHKIPIVNIKHDSKHGSKLSGRNHKRIPSRTRHAVAAMRKTYPQKKTPLVAEKYVLFFDLAII